MPIAAMVLAADAGETASTAELVVTRVIAVEPGNAVVVVVRAMVAGAAVSAHWGQYNPASFALSSNSRCRRW